MLTMFRKTEKKTTKIPTTALSSVTFPTLHLVIYSLLLTFSQPHVQRQEQSKEDLKIAASAERSLCSIWEWARFNNSSLNTNEIKYSGLQGSLSDDHCFENPSFSPPVLHPENLLCFPDELCWLNYADGTSTDQMERLRHNVKNVKSIT